jgi:hypothetical protein
MATQLGDFTAGQILEAADLNDIAVWTDYTPAFASGVTVGNGTWVAGYAIVNRDTVLAGHIYSWQHFSDHWRRDNHVARFKNISIT